MQTLHKNLITRFFGLSITWLDILFYLNAIAMNVLMFVGYKYDFTGSSTEERFSKLSDFANITLMEWVSSLLFALESLQLLLSVLRLVWYVIEKGTLKTRRRYRVKPEYLDVWMNAAGGPRYYYLYFLFYLTDGYMVMHLFFLLYVRAS